MLEQIRLYSFNFSCPEIQETRHSTVNNSKGRSYYARYHKKRNSHGHHALLLTDIPGDQETLEHCDLHTPITFDYLDLASEESLPNNLNPFFKNNDMTLNVLSILGSSFFTDQQWLAMFTLDVLTKSIHTNLLPFTSDPHITTANTVFKETTEKHPDKKVLVINSHGGGKPLFVGERYGTLMPIRSMLRNVRSNVRQFSEGKSFTENYSSVLLSNCDPDRDELPDYLGKYLGVKIFNIFGKAGVDIEYPKVTG